MSADSALPTSDLRSQAQDYKRDAAHKHKWALGAIERVGRASPRPQRQSDIFHPKHPSSASARKQHDLVDPDALTVSSSDSSSSDDGAGPAVPADAGVMYSFDSVRGPSQGSQILNVALAKAVEKFEDKETAKLVKTEYDVLDDKGDSVGIAGPSAGKRKAKGKMAAGRDGQEAEEGEDDYEFV